MLDHRLPAQCVLVVKLQREEHRRYFDVLPAHREEREPLRSL